MYEVHARQTNGEDIAFTFYDLNLDDTVATDFPDRVYEFVVSSTDASGASRRDDLVAGDSNGGGGLTKSNSTGAVAVFFPLAEISEILTPGVYGMACRYTIEGPPLITKQTFVGTLTIDEGHFS
jgi:hypothetical protein